MGRHSTFRPLVHALMADGKARSSNDIAAEVGCEAKYARTVMSELMEEKKAFIDSYQGKWHTAYYRVGVGENAPLPEFKTPESERMKRWVLDPKRAGAKSISAKARERAIDDNYRAGAAWWPQADPVVVGAMVAMVRAGQVSA